MQEKTHARGVSSRPDRASVHDPNVGRVLDNRYRIGDRIARGGMASVYEARDLRLDRTVAVKIMHAGLGDGGADEEFARRFVREARAAAGLSHPHVVSVYDQGEDDGTVYLAMEMVAGHTLRDTISKEAPMPPAQALALIDPVLSALAAAHRAGLVHRDVKPENVLIADDPASHTARIKVADFGLAKAVSAETQHTTNGVLIGTVSYLAPELVTEGAADARADVYAVGVILYELLTGAKPHTGDTPIQVAYRHVHHDVPPPSEAIPGIPDYVDALVARATARNASQRSSDAGVLSHQVHRVALALRDGLDSDADLVDDLLPSARGGDTSPDPISDWWNQPDDAPAAHPTGKADRASREPTTVIEPAPGSPAHANTPGVHPVARRRRRPVALLVVLALLVGLGGAGYWFGWGRFTETPSVIGLSEKAAETKLDKAGFGIDFTDGAYSETTPEGDVISTQPGPGDRVLPDDTIEVTVSLGPERYDIPDLQNLSLEEATAKLEDVKMVVGRTREQWSETVPEGSVIKSLPEFGTKRAKSLPVDTAVTLLVSKGPQPIDVTDWTGQSASKAKKSMEKAGLKVKITERKFSESVDQGDVISQSPTSGSLYKNDVVKLVVSKGMPFVKIPSVWRQSTEDATTTLEDLGFKVVVENATIHLGLGVASSTDPPAGSKARKGSTITLYEV